MSNSDPTSALVLGFAGGLYSFFRGFKIYREFRVVEDTPQIPIRSISMGLVNIRGKAVGDAPMPSPVTRTPCYFYKVDIEKWKQEQHSSGWVHYRTDMDGSRFYLEDVSGKVLVDAHGAELDLTKTGVHEVASAGSNAFQRGAATDEELLRYVSRAQLNGFTSFLARGVAAVHPLQEPQNEQARQSLIAALQHSTGPSGISPEMTTFVSGMIEKRLASAGSAIDPRQQQVIMAMREVFKHPMGSPEFMEQVHAALAQFPNEPGMEQKIAEMEEKLRQQQDQPYGFFPPASGRYRFTEYCILPGQEYNVTGSCVENPDAKNDHDLNLITKGVNEPTYLISDKTLGNVESGLRRRAVLMVFGGALVAVACLGFLLAKLGLF